MKANRRWFRIVCPRPRPEARYSWICIQCMVFLYSSIFKGNVIWAPSAMTAFDYMPVMLSANFISEMWVPTNAVSIAVTIYL